MKVNMMKSYVLWIMVIALLLAGCGTAEIADSQSLEQSDSEEITTVENIELDISLEETDDYGDII